MVLGSNAPAGDAFHVRPMDTGVQQRSAQPHLAASNQQPDDDMTGYQQTVRPSIVPGVDSADLLKIHRQSLAQLSGASQMEFSGVTLSRRHTTRKEEYDAAVEEKTQKSFEGFSFGE